MSLLAGSSRPPRPDGGGIGSLSADVDRHQPDELLLTANIYDHRARLRSFELAMQAWHARHATVPA